MAILINDTAPRSQYTATASQTVFTVPFEFFENADLKIYKNSTLLTLTTNYTVTGAGVSGGGSVTLVTGATAGDIVTIVRDLAVKRVTDFPTSGPFNVEALNTDLDRLTAMVQQQETLDTRSLRLDQFDTPNSFNSLPVKADRIGRVLQFNSSTGQPEAGPTTSEVANAQTYATNASTSATASAASAATSSAAATSTAGSVAAAAASASAASTSASNAATSASNAATSATAATTNGAAQVTLATAQVALATTQATNAATSASNAATSATAATTNGAAQVTLATAQVALATTQATNAATSATTATTQATAASTSATAANTAKTAAESARDATLAAYDSFDDRYLGVKSSNPTLDNDGNALVAGSLYFSSTSNGMFVYTGSAWVSAYVSGTGFLATSNNLSELTATASTARTNIGLGTAATMTGPAGTIVGTTDSQTLTNKTLTSPIIATHIGGTAASSTLTLQSTSGVGTSDAIILQTGSQVERIRVDTSGNVGIGTSSPQAKLSVSNSGAAGFEFYANAPGGGTGTYIQCYNRSAAAYVDMYYYAASHTWRANSSTTAMVLDTSGNLGVGITSPSTYGKLAVTTPTAGYGVLSVRNSAGGGGGGQLAYYYGTAKVAYVDSNVTNGTGGSETAELSFATANAGTIAERFRIGASGQLGIGGATYGTSGQVLTSGGASAAPTWSAPATSAINFQTFASSGTWTKPSGYSASSRVLIQGWGGGGAGGKYPGGSGSSGGGGGGGYIERWVTLSQLGATETVTIGAGGTAATTNVAGGNGGNSSLGSLLIAYGGAGGGVAGNTGGNGGSAFNAGTSLPQPYIQFDGSGTVQGGAGGADATTYGGGGGNKDGSGGRSVYGGGGGGGGNSATAAGTSLYGGNGGGGTVSTTAGSGSVPGGGGGGTNTGASSGAGGAGQIYITVFPA